MAKNSILEMFGESAGQVENDMNKIVGKVPAGAFSVLLPLTAAEEQTMRTLVAVSGRGLTQVQQNILDFLIRRYMANGGADPRTLAPPPPPADGEAPGPAAGSMLDFSSPTNTIVKSLFLLSLSPMFAGSIHFYFISIGCAGAIIYSLIKSLIK